MKIVTQDDFGLGHKKYSGAAQLISCAGKIFALFFPGHLAFVF